MTMKFHKLTLENISEVQPFLKMLGARTCDYSVGGLFMWRDYYHVEYAIRNGTFYSRLYNEEGRAYYNLPISDDIVGAIRELTAFEKQQHPTVRFCTIPEDKVPLFSCVEIVGAAEEQNTYFDYLYRAEDITTLSGKKYSAQRNQINGFQRACSSWSFEDISDQNLDEVISFFGSSYHIAGDASPFEQEENEKVLEVLTHLDQYHMFGGALYADHSVVGFSLGEIIGDTLFTHIEKADRNRKGAYQMLTNQFSIRFATPEVRYINREEDMGDEGLRRAKESYHPVTKLKKFLIEVK